MLDRRVEGASDAEDVLERWVAAGPRQAANDAIRDLRDRREIRLRPLPSPEDGRHVVDDATRPHRRTGRRSYGGASRRGKVACARGREAAHACSSVWHIYAPTIEDSEIPGWRKGNLEVAFGQQTQNVAFDVTRDGRYLFRGEAVDLSVDPLQRVMSKISLEAQPRRGPADAKVVMVEYSVTSARSARGCTRRSRTTS